MLIAPSSCTERAKRPLAVSLQKNKGRTLLRPAASAPTKRKNLSRSTPVQEPWYDCAYKCIFLKLIPRHNWRNKREGGESLRNHKRSADLPQQIRNSGKISYNVQDSIRQPLDTESDVTPTEVPRETHNRLHIITPNLISA